MNTSSGRSATASTHRATPTRPARLALPVTARHRALGRTLVGGLFLVTGGIHLGLVAADPQVYEHFADQGLFAFVRTGWHDIVMADPTVWGLLAMLGEVLLGGLLLTGGRAAAWGWAGVILFHVLLMLFGWWVWVYSVPALAVLVYLARQDLRHRGRP